MRTARGSTRTSVVVAATAVALAGLGTSLVYADPGTSVDAPGHKAKNIILLIGDGMGTTHIDAARQRYYGAAGKLVMEQLPVLGSVSTYAVEPNSDKPEYVTDSASAATAWSSGVKTYNAAIGKDAYGNVVPTLMEQAKAAGMRTGNVSNAEITDATPAGMFSHASQRACQGPKQTQPACGSDVPIAEQIARNNVADVILGGGLSRFEPDDEAAMKANGYTVLGSFGDPAVALQTDASQRVATRTDLSAVTGSDRRVIGLFNRGNMTIEKYKREHPGAPQTNEPGASEMTKQAIRLLQNSQQAGRKGMFLQVEGALIDKRSHANDAAQTLDEMKEFDEAVRVARDFAERDGNTLVIVTADHECAGFNIIATGSFTNAEAAAPPTNVDSGNTANNSTPARASGNVKGPARSTGPINGSGAGDPKNFAPATFRTADDSAGVQDGSPDASLWLSYLSGNHTGASVELFASGPQSSRFVGKQDNTDLYDTMKASLRTLDR
jgi:alkaline phosphatase